MFRTGIRKNFTARHALRGDFGEESREHSHPYLVEWTVGSRTLDGNGFATDIALMQETLEKTLSEIDDRFLNDLPFFSDRQPSLENLAVFLSEKLAAGALRNQAVTMTVRIWESDSAWAEYETGH